MDLITVLRRQPVRRIPTLVLIMIVVLVSLLSQKTPPVMADGSDYSIDWIASAPYSYNHITGGGAYDDRTIGKDADVVESLEGGDFACDDLVTYLAQISIDNPAETETIEFIARFGANTTGQPGAGHVDIVNVAVNYGSIEDLIPGENDVDDGIVDNGDSTAALIDEYFDPDLASGGGSILNNPNTNADLVGVITVDNLEASDTSVVVRIDVQLGCTIPSSPTGNLQANLNDARVIDPLEDIISGGAQTIPFQNLDQIAFPQLNLLKTVSTDGICPGESTLIVLAGTTVYYCFEVYNNGNTALYNVTLNDPLLGGDITSNLVGLTDIDGDGNADDLAVGQSANNYESPLPYQVFQLTTNTATADADAVDPDTGSCTVDVYPDYGDLPLEFGLTLLADNGAHHVIGDLTLGATIDGEADGMESASADGDDLDAQGDDEDGVVLPTGSNWSDGTGNLDVTVSGNGCLTGWLDFTNSTTFGYDFSFDDSYTQDTDVFNELVIENVLLSPGTTGVSFDLPLGASNDNVVFYARFRLVPALFDEETYSCGDTPGLTGAWTNGEVEDYVFLIGPTAVTLAVFEASSNTAKPIFWLAALTLLGFAISIFSLVHMRRKKT